MTNLCFCLGPQAPWSGAPTVVAAELFHELPVAEGKPAKRALGHVVSAAECLDFTENRWSHDGAYMRVDTRFQEDCAGIGPLLRVAPRSGHTPDMADQVKIDLQKLRALIVANTGPGKPFTRRSLSLKASNGRNPDLVRDLMRVNDRKPTLETAAGICQAVGVDLSTVVRGVQAATEADEWMTVCQAVQAGVWREEVDWPADDRFEVKVGVPVEEGERYGAVVEGRSMDRVLPPGTVLECVKLIGSDIDVQDDDLVIVERVQGALRELTCKRLSRRPDGEYELRAESTLPEFGEPIPIGSPDPEHWGDDETRIVAVVIRAHLHLHRSLRRKAA